MQKVTIYASVAIASSIMTFGMSANASLLQNEPAATSSEPDAVQVARHGADDNNKGERHGRGRDDGPNHAQNAPFFLLMARHVQTMAQGTNATGAVRTMRQATTTADVAADL
jgi:hypothetical protein